MISHLLESRPVRFLAELPTTEKVLLISAVAIAIIACMCCSNPSSSTGSNLFFGSGGLSIAGIINTLTKEKSQTSLDETRYTIRRYVPDKLAKQRSKANEQERPLLRTGDFIPLPPNHSINTIDTPLVTTFQHASAFTYHTDTITWNMLHDKPTLTYNDAQLPFEVLGFHNGQQEANAHVRANFFETFERNLPSTGWGLSDRIICNALTKTFVELKRTFTGEGASRALYVIKCGESLFISNVGDNTAAFLPSEGRAEFLTEQASPNHERFKRSAKKLSLDVPEHPRSISHNPLSSARPKITKLDSFQSGDSLLLANCHFWEYITPDEARETLLRLNDESVENKSRYLLQLARVNGAPEDTFLMLHKL